jgi:sugar lactone lactonase YvrE
MGAKGTARVAAISRMTLRDSEGTENMTFEVALRMRSFDELQARVAAGEKIASSEMEAKYFPLAADHERVVQWLKAQGLQVTRTDGNRLAVFGRGSVNAVARAFQVTFARVASTDGGEFTSAITAPSLPADLSLAVLGIHGLQPHIRRHSLSIPPGTPAGPRLNLNGGYLPSDIATAYNATGLSATGSGQTIAIYALAYPNFSDVVSFWALAGVTEASTNLQTIDVAGGPGASPDPSLAEEVTLDVEWSSALAPAAHVRIYGANGNDPGENDEILQQVYADLPSNPTMHQLCICIGGNELEVDKDYLIIEAQYMANLASAGVSVLSASGDQGAKTDGVVQVTYPTSDPDVTGVGGTSLDFVSNAVAAETAWSDSGDGSSSGGGASVVFSRPSWQVGVGVPAGTMRLVPDVAASADPKFPAAIYYDGSQATVGGTSWAAPIWTGFCALLNQGRSSPMGLLNPNIYPLNQTSSFRDITSGDNVIYNAGVGYDEVTGLGVPNVTALLAASASFQGTAAVNIPAALGNVVTTAGQPATFFVVGEGALPFSFQWQREPNGTSTFSSLTDNGTYSGSRTSTLVVDGTTAAMTGDSFRCVVSNSSGSATSAPATLTVNPVGVTTLAGWPNSPGHVDGTGWAARFSFPGSVRTDNAGNLYVSDSFNNTIRKVTPEGVVSTLAGVPGTGGSTNGPAATALFQGTAGVVIDSSGNLFVADNGNFVIRKVSASGTVSTLAGSVGTRGVVDGTGGAANFYDPQNLAIDSEGNLYVADGKGNVIRKVTPAGVVSTFAGIGIFGAPGTTGSLNGQGASAEFNDPTGIAVDAQGNVYVADFGNDTIRKITPGGLVSTLAGAPGTAGSANGLETQATFNGPAGVGVDSSGNVFVADAANDLVREVSPGGAVTTVAGSAGEAEDIDGLPTDARFNAPGDITVDSNGIIYVADSENQTIRRIIPGLSASAPSIAAQPVNLHVNVGGSAVFSVGVTGTPPFTYQWYFNSVAITGATDGSYTVDNAQAANAGSYVVTITNSEGTVTSSAAALTVGVLAGSPVITTQPQGALLPDGGSVALSVTVTGTAPFTYQWFQNGTAISGATAPSYAATVPGRYTVTVTNSIASTTSDPAAVGGGSRLINISTRALVGTGGNIMIAGFVIDGPAGVGKQVLIRGIGPALSAFGLGGLLSNPTISVFNSTSQIVATNTGWSTNSDPTGIATVAGQVGAFALPVGSADSELLASLNPGAYTVELSGAGATTGVGLVEVYEVTASDPATMVNISTRAVVGTGGSILIAGFVVSGTQPATVLVRGMGPALAAFITGSLAQPVLTVLDKTGTKIATNTGWGTNANAAQIAAAVHSQGAFAFAANGADSALLLTLQPGNYTAEVTGANGTTGTALAEVYLVQP